MLHISLSTLPKKNRKNIVMCDDNKVFFLYFLRIFERNDLAIFYCPIQRRNMEVLERVGAHVRDMPNGEARGTCRATIMDTTPQVHLFAQQFLCWVSRVHISLYLRNAHLYRFKHITPRSPYTAVPWVVLVKCNMHMVLVIYMLCVLVRVVARATWHMRRRACGV